MSVTIILHAVPRDNCIKDSNCTTSAVSTTGDIYTRHTMLLTSARQQLADQVNYFRAGKQLS